MLNIELLIQTVLCLAALCITLSKGLAEKGKASLGKILAVFFSICCIGGALGGGNMFQANQSFQQFVSVTGGQTSFFADKGWLFGLIIAIILGL